VTDDAWQRYRRALADRRLPAALVDLDALERNTERLLAPVRASGKRVRIATKSLRCPAVIARVVEQCGELACGLMTYTAEESAWWAAGGLPGARDLVLAYPTVRRADVEDLVAANRAALCAVVIDDAAHVDALAPVARAAGVTVPCVIELDVAWQPIGGVHVGVRRSPLRGAEAIVALARRVADTDGVRFHGMMAYDAHVAGLTDAGPFHRWQNGLRRAMKRAARGAIEAARAEVACALADAGLPCEMFNGGGTGSIAWSVADPTLTEITIGSGFIAPHLFDGYRGLELEPAALFALQVVRRPSAGVVTCHGGGYVASGDGGRDRLPLPILPAGSTLLALEGAGEVQTPVALARGIELQLGDPVLFRHAKGGELAEHFDRYLLVRGDRVVEEVPTWRGLGKHFLG
jgi:D-serine deaminase-like pyridoxal phosphate-dependent protein